MPHLQKRGISISSRRNKIGKDRHLIFLPVLAVFVPFAVVPAKHRVRSVIPNVFALPLVAREHAGRVVSGEGSGVDGEHRRLNDRHVGDVADVT